MRPYLWIRKRLVAGLFALGDADSPCALLPIEVGIYIKPFHLLHLFRCPRAAFERQVRQRPTERILFSEPQNVVVQLQSIKHAQINGKFTP